MIRICNNLLAVSLIYILLVGSCAPGKNEKVKLQDLHFSTTDASELFFKNVRRSDYQVEELPEAKMEIYRPNTSDRQVITPALIINWANDQAFIILEKAPYLSDELKIIVAAQDGVADTIYFDGSQQRQHAEAAVSMYNAILDQRQLLMMKDGEVQPIFTKDSQESFRRIVFDFLRLVELR